MPRPRPPRRGRAPTGPSLAGLPRSPRGSSRVRCSAGAEHRRRLAVVAGEDTWGNIAAQLGGDHVEVTSIITNPNADPHEYTADAADAAAIASAASSS